MDVDCLFRIGEIDSILCPVLIPSHQLSGMFIRISTNTVAQPSLHSDISVDKFDSLYIRIHIVTLFCDRNLLKANSDLNQGLMKVQQKSPYEANQPIQI